MENMNINIDPNSDELPPPINSSIPRINSKILFIRTISGLPLCSLCNAEAGHCIHTDQNTKNYINYYESNNHKNNSNGLHSISEDSFMESISSDNSSSIISPVSNSTSNNLVSNRSKSGKSSLEKLFAYSTKKISDINLQTDYDNSNTLEIQKSHSVPRLTRSASKMHSGSQINNNHNNVDMDLSTDENLNKKRNIAETGQFSIPNPSLKRTRSSTYSVEKSIVPVEDNTTMNTTNITNNNHDTNGQNSATPRLTRRRTKGASQTAENTNTSKNNSDYSMEKDEQQHNPQLQPNEILRTRSRIKMNSGNQNGTPVTHSNTKSTSSIDADTEQESRSILSLINSTSNIKPVAPSHNSFTNSSRNNSPSFQAANSDILPSLPRFDSSQRAQIPSILHQPSYHRGISIQPVSHNPTRSSPSLKPINSNESNASNSNQVGVYCPPGYFVYCDKCDSVKSCLFACLCVTCKQPVQPDSIPQSWNDCLQQCQIRTSCISCNVKSTWSLIIPKCSHCYSIAIPLTQFESNIKNQPCACCYSEEEMIINFRCNNNHVNNNNNNNNNANNNNLDTMDSKLESHVQCLECFVTYAKVSVTERKLVLDREKDAYTVSCPLGCANSCVDSQMLRLLGVITYRKYKRYSALNYAEDFKIQWCPYADCGHGFQAKSSNNDSNNGETTSKFLQCYACKRIYCKECLKSPESHNKNNNNNNSSSNNNTCDTNIDMNSLSESDRASMLHIMNSCKRCPSCGVYIYRFDGCNHMTCAKCRFEFCWLHLIEWGENCQKNHWFNNRLRTQALYIAVRTRDSVCNQIRRLTANHCSIM